MGGPRSRSSPRRADPAELLAVPGIAKLRGRDLAKTKGEAVNSIKSRLKRLEGIAGVEEGCPECRSTPEASPEAESSVEELERLHREGVLRCPGCGRITHFTFRLQVELRSEEIGDELHQEPPETG